MKRILIPLFAILVVAVSCKSEAKKATAFNNQLANINREIAAKGQALQPIMRDAMASKDFSKLVKPVNELSDYIDAKLPEVTALENVGGSEKFKTAFIDFLKYEKEMMATVDPFTKMNENTAQEELEAAVQTMIKKADEESLLLTKLKAVQQEYAAKHGFKIEKLD